MSMSQAVHLDSLGFNEKIFVFYCVLSPWCSNGSNLSRVQVFWGNTIKLILHCLGFCGSLRAHKNSESGRCTWENICTDLIVMWVTYVKRVLHRPLIGILGNNTKLQIVNILKIKKHYLNARRQGQSMWFELLTIQTVTKKPPYFRVRICRLHHGFQSYEFLYSLLIFSTHWM